MAEQTNAAVVDKESTETEAPEMTMEQRKANLTAEMKEVCENLWNTARRVDKRNFSPEAVIQDCFRFVKIQDEMDKLEEAAAQAIIKEIVGKYQLLLAEPALAYKKAREAMTGKRVATVTVTLAEKENETVILVKDKLFDPPARTTEDAPANGGKK